MLSGVDYRTHRAVQSAFRLEANRVHTAAYTLLGVDASDGNDHASESSIACQHLSAVLGM